MAKRTRTNHEAIEQLKAAKEKLQKSRDSDGIVMVRADIIALYEAGERDFSCTDCSEIDFFAMDLTGASFDSCRLIKANLSDGNFSGVNFNHAHMEGIEAESAIFQGASFIHATLSDSKLKFTNFTDAVLTNAYISWCKLDQASFKNADLTSATFTQSDLEGVHLTNANLDNAGFVGASFQGAKGIVSASGIGAERRYIWAWNTGKSWGIRLGCQQFSNFDDAIDAVKKKYQRPAYAHHMPAYIAQLEVFRLILPTFPEKEVKSDES